MECGNPEIFNFCISSTKVFISYTFQMLHLLQVKRFEQNIPISYIKFFYSLWEITNKDNILRGTVPWTFLEGCRHLTSTAFGLKWLYTYLCSLLYHECLEKTDQILFQHLLSLWRQYEQYCAWKCICKFLLNLKMHTMFYINFIVVEIYTI